MGETRVDLQHLLEDLRDAYTGPLEESIVTELVANALDAGVSDVRLWTDPAESTLTIVDDGRGMQRRELARYHDVALTVALALAPVAVATGDEHFFVTRFLAEWGNAQHPPTRRTPRRRTS